jgi:hypothetical protein
LDQKPRIVLAVGSHRFFDHANFLNMGADEISIHGDLLFDNRDRRDAMTKQWRTGEP